MSSVTRHEADPDIYRIEPYAACQFIYGPETDRPGEGSHSWATGTAPWTLIVVWEWILGVRPEVEGLLIDPCMPSDWTHAMMTRLYRGATYEIEFEKKKGICKGNVEVILDGIKLPTNIIKPQNDNSTHDVKVIIR
jgi:cellobiose phosphorylase